MTYIKPFTGISHDEAACYGGKVASLGEMVQAGIAVPSGFGINVDAYREFRNKPFSEEFRAELQSAVVSLGAERMAVRSSAVAEDSLDASWAGQLESYLNVEAPDLERSIRDCWRSIEADHVREYAKDKHLSADAFLVGVAVQAMVDADAAGVMFTANPVTNDRSQMMIEAAYGLGELVVQGLVTPDNFLVDTKAFEVIHFGIAIKERMMVYRDHANQTIDVDERLADRAVLREDEVRRLARLGAAVADHYGRPQDIEWCRAKGKFFIVQARPITTLK